MLERETYLLHRSGNAAVGRHTEVAAQQGVVAYMPLRLRVIALVSRQISWKGLSTEFIRYAKALKAVEAVAIPFSRAISLISTSILIMERIGRFVILQFQLSHPFGSGLLALMPVGDVESSFQGGHQPFDAIRIGVICGPGGDGHRFRLQTGHVDNRSLIHLHSLRLLATASGQQPGCPYPSYPLYFHILSI